jgi:hypothetical protein
MQSCGRRSRPPPPTRPYSRLGLLSSSRGKEAFGARVMQGLHETGVAAASVVPARCPRAPSFRQDRFRDWNCCPSRLVFGPSPARRRRISTGRRNLVEMDGTGTQKCLYIGPRVDFAIKQGGLCKITATYGRTYQPIPILLVAATYGRTYQPIPILLGKRFESGD